MFWFDVDEQIKNDHFCIFLLHNWNLKSSVHEKLIFTQMCIRITVGVSTIVVDPGSTHFNDKIWHSYQMEFFFTTQNTQFDQMFGQLRSEQSDRKSVGSDSWFSIWWLRKMANFITISCGFCRYNDIQNSREIEKVLKIVYCSISHCLACEAMT